MKETVKTIIEWNEQTFPDATLEGQFDKYFCEEKELLEAKKTGTEEEILSEMADCFIVSSGLGRFDIIYAARFMGRAFNMFAGDPRFTVQKVQAAIDKKMAINRNRQWNFNNGSYQHKEQ